MTAYHPSQEPPTARLLHIFLEGPARTDSDFRHISTRVVRRAMADTLREDGSVHTWNDGARADGYRSASWHNSTEKGVYVEGLNLRGQMDVRGTELQRDGEPYGNEVEFAGMHVRAREAALVAKTFDHLRKATTKLEKAGHVFDTNKYADMARLLALSLGIKKCIIYRKGLNRSSYDQDRDFVEFPLKDIEFYVRRLVDEAHGRNQ